MRDQLKCLLSQADGISMDKRPFALPPRCYQVELIGSSRMVQERTQVSIDAHLLCCAMLEQTRSLGLRQPCVESGDLF